MRQEYPMDVRRTAAVLIAGGVAAVAGLAPAVPALGHGATTQPISRTAACAQNGEDTGTAACKAALKANGGAFGTFDNLRVPNVNGKDRQVIPDGKLCSGGLSAFKGLDLPRDDYPATKLPAGGTLNVQYRTTIPHEGSFRVYLTKQGFNPARALKWSDIPSKPFLTADNPSIRGGAYRMSGKLPSDRSGRHIVFVIWQTTSTPDTYYSCSDVVIKAAAGSGAAVVTRKAPRKKPTPSATPPASTSPAPVVALAPTASYAGGDLTAGRSPSLVNTSSDAAGSDHGRQALIGGLVVLVGVAGALAFLRTRRRNAAQRIHRGRGIR
jgi:predicted carbohydrate-binding protein with CBM5 and CBM33 domain